MPDTIKMLRNGIEPNFKLAACNAVMKIIRKEVKSVRRKRIKSELQDMELFLMRLYLSIVDDIAEAAELVVDAMDKEGVKVIDPLVQKWFYRFQLIENLKGIRLISPEMLERDKEIQQEILDAEETLFNINTQATKQELEEKKSNSLKEDRAFVIKSISILKGDLL